MMDVQEELIDRSYTPILIGFLLSSKIWIHSEFLGGFRSKGVQFFKKVERKFSNTPYVKAYVTQLKSTIELILS